MSTATDITKLQQRVTLLENVVNDVQIAIMNLATQEQLRQLILIKQEEFESLSAALEEVQGQITLLQNEVFS